MIFATTAHRWTGAKCRGDRLLVTLSRCAPQDSNHPKHQEILRRHPDSRSGICHTEFRYIVGGMSADGTLQTFMRTLNTSAYRGKADTPSGPCNLFLQTKEARNLLVTGGEFSG